MACDDNPRFRITAYPGAPIPVDELDLETASINWVIGPGGGIWDAKPGAGRWPTRRLGESYLELAALDLNSVADIQRFLDRWGILGVRWHQDVLTAERVEDPDYRHIFGWVATDGLYAAICDELREATGESQIFDITLDLRGAALPRPDRDAIEETVDEFVFGATYVRDLLRAWRWLRDGQEPGQWECALHVRHPPSSAEEAAEWFRDWSIPLLAPFHPQFQLATAGDLGSEPIPPYYGGVSLLNVMVLEMYNHVCEQAEYKTCANETCGRLFVRQQGRAKHGQFRNSGVLYCTPECARAQAQREYRRRNSPAKRSRDEHAD